jgi:hypothetical protein
LKHPAIQAYIVQQQTTPLRELCKTYSIHTTLHRDIHIRLNPELYSSRLSIASALLSHIYKSCKFLPSHLFFSLRKSKINPPPPPFFSCVFSVFVFVLRKWCWPPCLRSRRAASRYSPASTWLVLF